MAEEDYVKKLKKKYNANKLLSHFVLVTLIIIIIIEFIFPNKRESILNLIGGLASYIGLFLSLYTIYKVEELKKSLLEKKINEQLLKIYDECFSINELHLSGVYSNNNSFRGFSFSELIKSINSVLYEVKRLNQFDDINIDLGIQLTKIEEEYNNQLNNKNKWYISVKLEFSNLMLSIDKVIKKRNDECK